jgi:subtilisin family serine protease
MNKCRVAALLAVTLLTSTGVAAGAPDPAEALAEAVPLATGVAAHGGASERIGATLTRATGAVTAFVELAETAAVETFNAEQAKGASRDQARDAAQQTRRRSDAKADKVVGALRDRDAGTKEVAKTSNAVSGVVVTADAAHVRELAALPEVKAVRLSVPKVVQNASSVQLTRALKVWQDTGRLGDGIRIGVVDTGIDYTHTDFGGPGTTAAYEAIDRASVDPSFFPTAKVVGGKDFAGDDYDASDPAKSTPKPDGNPLDCAGHGTHVAGTAAGYGVGGDGTTFTGDYAALTPEALNGMKIGPGSAPKASLYALKIFGCKGSTNLTTQALDWSLDPNGDGDFSDHLDVVNLSLGSDFGGQDDPDALFVRRITAQGVLVVASAGNGGDFFDVGGSPANTPEALAVANTRDAFALLDGAEVAGTALPGQYSQSFTGYPTLDTTLPVVATTVDGCDPLADPDIAGKFVWLEWDENDSTRKCGSAVRADHAQAAGAAGVLLSSTRDNFLAGIAGNAGIPMFQFTGTATDAVRPALQDGTLRVRLTGALRNSVQTTTPRLADTITPSSSRGARGPIAAKPDIAAPGDTILSAHVGTGNGAISMGGTSMAAPHVAGITALVRQTHPMWTPEEVKAAVMNTAGADVKSGDDNTSGTVEAPMRVGAGRIDARAAVSTEVLAMVEDNPGSVGVSFGPVEAVGPVTLSKTVRVVNKGSEPQRVRISYQAATSVPGAEFVVSPSSVSVDAGEEAHVKVTLRIPNPGALRKVADPTLVKTQADQARQYIAEASGLVLLSTESGTLRVPVYAAPKPTSDITGSLAGDKLTLRGRGLRQGAGDQAYRSLVSVFELQGTSGRLPDCGADKKTDCAINESARGGDLRYVGATAVGDTLAFGVVTWDNWATLGSNNTPKVSIDTTGDGKPDFTVEVAKPKDPSGSVTADVWLARTKAVGGDVVDEQPVNGHFGDLDTNVMDSNVVVLPVSLKALGIDIAQPSHPITYTVGTDGTYAAPGNADGYVDRIPTPLSFDPLAPRLSTGAVTYEDKPGASIVVRGSGTLLLLHHHNARDQRAQVI